MISHLEVAYALGGLVLLALIDLSARPRVYYIVRHGETLLNAEHIKQGPEGGLSEKGKAQAREIGAILKPLRIRKIISSPYERAKETSELINESLGVSISYTPLLSERRNPSIVIGKHRDDPIVVEAMDKTELAYHGDDYRYADEENFTDMKVRARQCLDYLAKRGSVRTCVVTHHAFLKMLLAYGLYRENLHADDFVKLSFFNQSDNGGISIMEYRPWRRFGKTRGWKVVSFNETYGE